MIRLILAFLRPYRAGAVVAVGVTLGLLLIGSAVGPGVVRLAQRVAQNLAARTVTVTATSPVIVERLHALNRLETARQVTSHVVEASSDTLPLPQFLVRDRLMMLVQTEAVAGVDLSRLAPEDVQVRGSGVAVRLPEPELFTVTIADEHSKVYTRERGWFVMNPDPDLERQARLKAKADARRAASRGELVSAAKTNAESNLRSLLQTLGFEEVEFQWGGPVLVASRAADGRPAYR